MPSVSVLGAGSFGTAVAVAIARSGFPVQLYCRSLAQAEEMAESGENRRYFPGHLVPKLVSPTNDLAQALTSEVIFLAFPARALDFYIESISAANPTAVIVNLVKGLHPTHFTFAQLFAERLPDAEYVALKGPTFAKPIFLGELSGLTCATRSLHARELTASLFAGSMIDLDYCDDPVAVDALSAIKNVYAVAIGMGSSLGFSENTIFLLISKVAKEIKLILSELVQNSDAFWTYSGLGDILLTGLCDTSRNRTLGFMIGRSLYIDFERSGFLTEGARAFTILRDKVGVELPILTTVSDILEHRAEPLALLETLGLKHSHY